jgi:predicted CXXCH cytochrome family protein
LTPSEMRNWACWVVGVIFSFGCVLASQDLDSVPSTHKRDTATLADQIIDPPERAAFLALFKQAVPSEMRERAHNFITRFPKSAFLAQAYEVAARGSFALEGYEEGLREAQESLALLPENPLLLVVVADVEARLGRNDAAIEHAEKALGDLQSFSGPASIRDEDWPKVKMQLLATAHFAKGRALLQQALRQPRGETRRDQLGRAEASLASATDLRPDDLEIGYTLGLVQLSGGNAAGAAIHFAKALRGGGDLAAKADDALRSIWRLQYPSGQVPYESFRADTEKKAETLKAAEQPHLSGGAADAKGAAYFGSASCRGCHAEIYREWSQTGMSKMLRPYAPENVAGDFTTNNQFFLGDELTYREGKVQTTSGRKRTPFARMIVRNGRHYFELFQSDNAWHTYPVAYTIGSKFEQAYATRLPNGEIHVFPVQYNLKQKCWVNFWKVIDGPDSERADPRTWERLDASTSYQAVCAVCHTSQLRNTQGGGFAVNNVEFREPGINCEMCHGPSAEHAIESSMGDYHPKPPLDPPVNFKKITAQQFTAICAQCHMQSAIRVPGTKGELNYSTTGNFFEERERSPFGEFSRKGFFKDGRFRQSTFIVEALERSKCFRGGNVSCGNCHDPHGHDSAKNLTSLKFRDHPDLMCTGCHASFSDTVALASHTHHLPGSDGSRCVSCHMPRIMHALLFDTRYHQIDDIPDAALTKRFGQQESPNACLLCHAAKDADWVQQQLTEWKQLRASEKQ